MQSIRNAMQSANAMEEVQRSNMVANISKVVDCSNKITGRRKYAYGFLLGLILNIANVVFNVWLMNTFLGGDFLNLGIKYSILLNVDKYYKYELLLKISK